MRQQHSIEYLALISFARLIVLLPRKAALSLGSAIGNLGWTLRIRRQLVLSNIARARPQASAAELRAIGKKAAQNFGRTIAEIIRYGTKEREKIRSLVAIQGVENLKATLSRKKGAIILTGHFGSWPLYFAAMSFAGIPMSLLIGRQHNQKVDDFILKIPGDDVELITKGRTAIKKILSNLADGRAVIMAADQYAGEGGISVPLLGEKTSTLALPGSLASKYQVPVFMMSGYRQEDHSHQVAITPLELKPQTTQQERKIEVARAYNRELGNMLTQNPEHYFWYHRRWRDDS